MDGWGTVAILDAVARETTLFAAVGFLVGGLDDLAVDLVFLGRIAWRRLRGPDGTIKTPAPPKRRIAIFVPAWEEASVIGQMLRHALATLDHPDYRIYTATYPNDAATIAAVAEVALADARIRLVIGNRPGPTTKGDNLNTLWRALAREEDAEDWRADAIVLHDAEDVMHAQELAIFDRLLATHAVIQLPVLPLIAERAPWISGHYADEFAEAHTKSLVVRQVLGAGLPLAGVGCAIRRDALEAVARARGAPFDGTSLTEDYELGLRIAEMGGSGCLARVRETPGGPLVAVRAYFPATIRTAVIQKARWMTGIALLGWDRIGWSGLGNIGDHWMRMRDRRAPLAVLVLAAAYLAIVAGTMAWGAHLARGFDGPPMAPWMTLLLIGNGMLLAWRLVVRAACTAHAYGWREGAMSVPRMLVANLIALLAARRAVGRYIAILRGAPTRWDKTAHVFPDSPATIL